MRFENTVTIRRPAEDVFVFLADFENVRRWNHAIQSTTKTSRAGRGREHLSPDLRAEQERGGVRGDGVRADASASHRR
jgi:hypothetical protein